MLLYIRVEKSGEHGEHAPGTPKAFPRNTYDKNQSKSCFHHVCLTFQAILHLKIASLMIFTLQYLYHCTVSSRSPKTMRLNCSAIDRKILSSK